MPAIRRTYSQRRSVKSKSTYGAKRRPRADKYKSDVDTTNLNVKARLSTKDTNIAKTTGPFPPRKFYNFEYSNALTQYSPAATTGYVSCKPSDLYDFDNNAGAYFGNKQPLFYDSLLTTTGPYKAYKVHSWVITYTITNQSAGPVTVFGFPSLATSSEMDIVSEMDNWPGVQRLFLSASGGAKSMGTLTVKGGLGDVYPQDITASSLGGSWNASPTAPIYGGVGFSSGTPDNVSVSIAVKATLYTELGVMDSTVS